MMNKILKWVMLTGRYLFLCVRGAGGGEGRGGVAKLVMVMLYSLFFFSML